MNIEQYQLKSGLEFLNYEFISEGPRGLIPKRIQFTLVNRQGIYNLAFGDKDLVTGEIDDKAISNNGDSEKVLATVVGAVFAAGPRTVLPSEIPRLSRFRGEAKPRARNSAPAPRMALWRASEAGNS